MENKYRKFYVEWWNIRRSTIYRTDHFRIVRDRGRRRGLVGDKEQLVRPE